MESLKYSELQSIARKLGVRANQKKGVLCEQIAVAQTKLDADAVASGAAKEAAAAPPVEETSTESAAKAKPESAASSPAPSATNEAEPDRKRQRIQWTDSPGMPTPLPSVAGAASAAVSSAVDAPTPQAPAAAGLAQQRSRFQEAQVEYRPAPIAPPSTSVVAPVSTVPRPGPADGRVSGVCLRWVPDRGFGFLRADSGAAPDEDIFCHSSAITDGTALTVGARVSFTIDRQNPSRPRAEQVTGGSPLVVPNASGSAGAAWAARGGGALPPVTPGKHGGTVLRWNQRGFGFVRADLDQSEIFVHSSAILDGNALPVGGRVEYILSVEGSRKRGEQCTGGVVEQRQQQRGGGGAYGAHAGYTPPQAFAGYGMPQQGFGQQAYAGYGMPQQSFAPQGNSAFPPGVGAHAAQTGYGAAAYGQQQQQLGMQPWQQQQQHAQMAAMQRAGQLQAQQQGVQRQSGVMPHGVMKPQT
jgi:cold shock CspA family protein